jgi:hypothetical protein
MAIWTNVPDSVLEPGDPIRSVDIIAIKENGVWNRETHGFEIISDTGNLTTSGTYSLPAIDEYESIVAIIIGGGGSGGAGRVGTTSNSMTYAMGGTTEYGVYVLPRHFAGKTITYVVGAGGASVSATTNAGASPGNAGGSSSLVVDGVGVFQRFGPGGAAEAFAITLDLNFEGNFINYSVTAVPAGRGYDAGLLHADVRGGGRGYSTGTVTQTRPFGGGGGSAAHRLTNARAQNEAGGFGNQIIGAGGNGNTAGNGFAGTFPGGGGGGCTRSAANATSGAGANGAVRFLRVKGNPAPDQVVRALLT